MKNIEFPIFLPDATRAVTKSLDSKDLENAGIEGVVVNTYHLAETPGVSVLNSMGGVKSFMNFKGLVVSDSGGWQIFSLIHRSRNAGKITDKGVIFSAGVKKKELFTPEKSVQVQFNIGSDMIICLDDFTPPDAPIEKTKETVERTILWAKRSKQEYLRILEQNKVEDKDKPLLFAVIQGNYSRDLRKHCADKLLQIGFDGLGYGGYAINEETHSLDLELSRYIAELIPEGVIRFALGVGFPYEIAMCNQMGWQIFDCTLPTRDARHKRLYVFTKRPENLKDLLNPETYSNIYIGREYYHSDERPISEFCDCHTCRYYSRAYIKHLFDIEDTAAYRLASIHNLRHYANLTKLLRNYKKASV